MKFRRLLAVIWHCRARIYCKIRKHYSTRFGRFCVLSTNHCESIYFAIKFMYHVLTSTTGYTRKSGIIILLYFVLTSPHSSITTLLVNFGRSFSFRSTTISYTDFVSLVPSDKRCYVGRNDRYEVGVRDKKHENSPPLDLHGVKFERISRIFDPTF